AIADIKPRSSSMTFFSTVTGGPMDTAGLDPGYWFRSIRQTVQFERALRSARDDGYGAFIECTPHPVLIARIEETLRAQPIVMPSLGREDGGLERFWLSVGQAHVAGVGVDWGSAFADSEARRVELPTYAFVRRRFWLGELGAGRGDVGGVGLAGAAHALLGAV